MTYTKYNQQGYFGESFVRVLASAAGLIAGQQDVDHTGVDFSIDFPGTRGTARFPKIEAQVKSWSSPKGTEAHWQYSMDVRNYNNLAGEFYVSRFLFLIIVPSDVKKFAHVDETSMRLSHCGLAVAASFSSDRSRLSEERHSPRTQTQLVDGQEPSVITATRTDSARVCPMTPYAAATAEELRAASDLPPETLSQYLTSTGWAQEQHLGRATLWTRREDDGDFEVLVPGDRTLRDYASRVSDFLATVAAVEERPIRLLLDDLEVSGADTLSFRLLPGGPSGTIPLFNAVDALAGVRELVVASTFSLMNAEPMLVQGRRPERVFDFARSVRLGTPRAGSWAIAAQLDVPTADSGDDPPLARQVSLQMHKAVRACHAASGEALREFDIELFLSRTSDGVSSNVCDALAKLGRDDVPYDVRFNWSRRLPATVPARSFRFSARRIEVLRTAAEELKAAVPDGEITVEGTVSKLRRDTGVGGQATVKGPLSTVYGSSERSVRVLLPDHLYQRVVDAHGRRHQVRVTGTAVRGRIERVTLVEVLADTHQT